MLILDVKMEKDTIRFELSWALSKLLRRELECQ